MPALSAKHLLLIILSVLLIFSLVANAWQHQQVGITSGSIFLLLGLASTGSTIIRKNRDSHRQGKISLVTAKRNICFEIAALLLAMTLAGFQGRYLAGSMTGNISDAPVKFLTGIGIGLLVGWAVGLFLKLASSRLKKD